MLPAEGLGLRVYRRFYLYRRGLRIVDSEEVSKRLFEEEVVCLEAELKQESRD